MEFEPSWEHSLLLDSLMQESNVALSSDWFSKRVPLTRERESDRVTSSPAMMRRKIEITQTPLFPTVGSDFSDFP